MFANEDEEKIVGLVWENVKTAFDVLDKKMEARSHSEEPFNIDDI